MLGLGEARRGQTVGEPKRIGIPTREVERFTRLEVIEIEKPTHEIMRHEPPGR